MSDVRRVKPLSLPALKVRAAPAGVPPVLLTVRPTDLYIDEKYQRDLSRRSIALIERIVGNWDWRAFKPPIVAEADGVMQVIDGQHTAIAAASLGLSEIPVLLTVAGETAQRANAFVQHNRDRVVVTKAQIYKAQLAAGAEDALTIQQVCDRAGVRIRDGISQTERAAVGDTVAIAAIAGLVARRFPIGARRVLEICVKSGAAPIAADLIKAVEELVFSEAYKGTVPDERISRTLSACLSRLAQDSHDLAVKRQVPRWRAVAMLIHSRAAG